MKIRGWAIPLLILLFCARASLHAQNHPGNPITGGTPWRFSFEASEWAFDSVREKLWLTDFANRKVVRVDLASGLAEREWVFERAPESIGITPDGARLYAALVSVEPSSEGVIAAFDLESNLETHSMRFPFEIGDLVLGHHYVVVSPRYGGSVYSYHLASGAMMGEAYVQHRLRLVLSPSLTRLAGAENVSMNPDLIRFTFSNGSFGQWPMFQEFGRGSRVFFLPGETNLLSENGSIYRSQPGSPQDQQSVGTLAVSPVMDLAHFPSTTGYVVAAGGGRLGYFENQNFTPSALLQLGRLVHGVGIAGSRHYAITVEDGMTIVHPRLMPSASAQGNLSPTIRWLAPANNTAFAAPATVQLLTEPDDPDGSIVAVEFLSGTTRLGVANAWPFRINASLTPGTHTIDAIATDNFGALSEPARLTVRVTMPPEISWTSPAGLTVLDAGSPLALQVNASDPGGAVSEVRFFEIDGALTNLLAVVTQAPYRFEIPQLTRTSTFLAVATDNDGITSTTAPALVQIAGRLGDDFYRPRVLIGENPVGQEDIRTATTQLFERPIGGLTGPHHSVWWSWRPPTLGFYSVGTRGSNFDTTLAAFTGTNLAALTYIASNDDDPVFAPFSRVKFLAHPATNYMIMVDGYYGATGLVNLQVTLDEPVIGPPPNDRFADRVRLSGALVVTNGSNVGATAEPSEPRHGGANASSSVWWQWTPPADGLVRISAEGSDFDTVLAVYGSAQANPNLFSLPAFAANDDALTGGLTSEVAFLGSARTNLFIAVQGFGGVTGNISLRIQLSQVSSNQPNDRFDGRLPVDGSEFQFEWSNYGATVEPGEPPIALFPRASVWWSWRAPANGWTYVRAARVTSATPMVGVFTGENVSQLTAVPRADPIKQSVYSFNAVAGTRYAIGVDTYSGSGVFNLSLAQTQDPLILPMSVELPASGEHALLNVGSASGRVVVHLSDDLVSWQPVLTNDVAPGELLTVPITRDRNQFFQLRPE